MLNNLAILKIYNYLDINSLLKCSLVNKQFNILFNNTDLIWDKIICKTYNYNLIGHIKEVYNVLLSRDCYKIIRDLLTINKVFNLDKTIRGLIKLKTLDNTNKPVPKEIRSLINLEEYIIDGVYLHVNRFQELFSLVSLKRLKLIDSKLVKLPADIGLLINLEYLSLRNNCLVDLPKEICQLTKLTVLNLSNNKLTKLPHKFGSLINLQHLCLDNNKFTKVPNEAYSLIHLKYLDLSNNSIVKVPKDIGYLVNLKYLYLGFNQIKRLPKEIGSLFSLTILSLDNNRLTKLPNEMKYLMDLRILQTSGNTIRLDKKVVNMKKCMLFI